MQASVAAWREADPLRRAEQSPNGNPTANQHQSQSKSAHKAMRRHIKKPETKNVQADSGEQGTRGRSRRGGTRDLHELQKGAWQGECSRSRTALRRGDLRGHCENPTSSSKRCRLQSTPAETRGAATARLRFVGISRVGRGLIQRGHIRQASAETRNL